MNTFHLLSRHTGREKWLEYDWMNAVPQASAAPSYSLARVARWLAPHKKSLSKKQGLTCNNGSCRSNYVAKRRIGLGNCGEVLQELEWVVKPSGGGCLYHSLWENVGMKWVFSAWWVGSPWGMGGREPLLLNVERSAIMGVQASGQEGTRLVKQSELSLVATD